MQPTHTPEQAVTTFCRNHLKEPFSILLAVSGGADSIALFHLFYSLREKLSLKKIGIAHVNHSLRGQESDEDERFVTDLAKKLQLPLFSTKLGLREEKNGMEAWARQERYRFFLKIKDQHDFDYIATGHTADDQAETVLMRLMRGAGISGMRAILPFREDGVVRPLLDIEKETLLVWLEKRNILFRTDLSNFDCCYRRNRIRHEVMPVLRKAEPQMVQNLCSFARRMLSISDLVEQGVNIWLRSHVIKSGCSTFHLKKEGFTDRKRASHGLVSLFKRNGIAVVRTHIEKILDTASEQSFAGALLPSGWRWYVNREAVVIYNSCAQNRKFSCVFPPEGEVVCSDAYVRFTVSRRTDFDERMPRDNKTVWLDVSEEDLPLLYRRVEEQDRFEPLGTERKVLLDHFLSKLGIPQWERKTMGVVVSGKGEVVWIPGIRISQKFRVKPQSKTVFVISCNQECW